MGNYIVADKNGLCLQCYRQGYKKENLVCNKIFLKQGELLTVTDRKKFIIDVGWFVLAKINGEEKFLLIEELDEAMQNGQLLDEIDCMLKLVNISHYLDEALASKNKEQFFKFLTLQKEISFLYEQLCEKMYITS